MNFMLSENLLLFTSIYNTLYRINTNCITDHTLKGIVTVVSESQGTRKKPVSCKPMCNLVSENLKDGGGGLVVCWSKVVIYKHGQWDGSRLNSRNGQCFRTPLPPRKRSKKLTAGVFQLITKFTYQPSL